MFFGNIFLLEDDCLLQSRIAYVPGKGKWKVWIKYKIISSTILTYVEPNWMYLWLLHD